MSKHDEEYDIPIDLSDILNVCKEYNKLGLQLQVQIESIVENGPEEAIKLGLVTESSLVLIKNFMNSIINNPYFGDSVYQAKEYMHILNSYTPKKSIRNLDKTLN